MMFSLFRRSSRQDTISTLYGTIVAQARLPCFYREYGVADTVNGRFDLLGAASCPGHRSFGGGTGVPEAGQALFDHFCQDMDHNLRKWVSAICRCQKKCSASARRFTAGQQAYQIGVWRADGEAALVEALTRNIYGGLARDAEPPGPPCGLYPGSGT